MNTGFIYETKIMLVSSRSSYTDESAERLRELILYISEQSVNDERYGKVKLNKVLLAADMYAYRQFGISISHADYKALDYGSAPVGMKDILDKMQNDEELAIQPTSYFGKPQERPINLRRANLAKFSGKEIALLDEVIKHFSDANAKQLSDWSHGIAWATAYKTGKNIPYAAFLFKQRQRVSERLVQKGFRLAKERGWSIYDETRA